MNKALLLLVDDEPPVLEALEAVLAPAFQQICRIETFEDPREVLEAVPGWEKERRLVAAAIVDQKMPGMTGVELLRRLRDAEPARFLRSALLTGYAGLPSALAAKNEAGVDRYLEKPWSPDALVETARGLLRRGVGDTPLAAYYALEEASTADHLLAIFRLRYSAYRLTPPPGMDLEPNEDHVHVDGHDRSSVLLALWHRGPEGDSLAGTARVITRESSPMLDMLQAAAARLSSCGELLDEPVDAAFPMVRQFRDRARVEGALAALERGGGRPGEIGGEVLEFRHRGHHMDTRQIEGTLSFLEARRCSHAVAAVLPLYRRHYARFGFDDIPDVRWESLPRPAVAVWSSVEKMRQATQGRMEALVRRLQTAGESTPSLCFCPTYPECVPGPYLSSRFAATDLLCPVAVQRTLAAGTARAGTAGPEDAP